ncbi:MAG: hypothetical protein IKY43_04550 [Bacteroidales bacterium]|nr:hypothetical protein [Bacteroidales bacterium]
MSIGAGDGVDCEGYTFVFMHVSDRALRAREGAVRYAGDKSFIVHLMAVFLRKLPKLGGSPYGRPPQQDKLDYYCKVAQASFYKTNTLPANAIVYQISAVVNKRTNENLSQSVEINLDTFSVFAYNFDTYRYRHWNQEVYFETSDPVNRYLVLRTEKDINNIVVEMLNNSGSNNAVNKCNKNK